jgi:hypothetical protein
MIQQTLQATVARILRPLVRVLIRYGMSYGEFNEVAKRMFVAVAADDFPIEGRKQTNSRIAMLTGIQRKEIARLVSLPEIETDELDMQYNRAVRVTSGWRRDADFRDADGTPMALLFEGDISFSELVRRYSGDLPARAVLDELLRVGTVTVNDDGRFQLVDDGVHVPHQDKEAQVNIMGNAGHDLLSTLDHNFECRADETRLQLTVAYNNLPGNAARRFQYISHEECVQLLKRFDEWLSEHDRDSNPAVEGDGRYRAGIGMYYFEEEVP